MDEATLAGTRDLDQLVTQARRAGAGVLLVGDHHQLSAVQAGGAFGLLARRTTTAELTGLWRFTHRWEAETTRLLRHGDPAAIDAYAAHGRIHGGGYDTVLTDALTAWRADTDAGLDSLLIAADNDTVRDLNTRIRTDNIATGRATVAGVDLWDGTTAGIGDRITTRHNDRSLRLPDGDHVRNGETWTITAIHHDGSLDARTTRPLENGEAPTRRLPADYVTEHVELGYAITAHRAQSATVDSTHVVTGPEMTREHLYVAMTRGRSANHAYLPLDAGGDVDEAHQQLTPSDRPVSWKDLLARILERTGAETSATESLQGHADPRRRAGVPRRPQIPGNELQHDPRSARNGPAPTR